MDESPRKVEQAGKWLNRTSMRLAECQAEIYRLDGEELQGRRTKLAARMVRYRDLIDTLRATIDPERPAPRPPIEELDEELAELRRSILASALDLAHAREHWRDLKRRWGNLADQIMTEREERGEAAGRVPGLDFRFSSPSPETPREERIAHEIIRSLDL